MTLGHSLPVKGYCGVKKKGITKLKTFQEKATWYILVVNYRTELKMITWEHFSPERRLA